MQLVHWSLTGWFYFWYSEDEAGWGIEALHQTQQPIHHGTMWQSSYVVRH